MFIEGAVPRTVAGAAVIQVTITEFRLAPTVPVLTDVRIDTTGATSDGTGAGRVMAPPLGVEFSWLSRCGSVVSFPL